MDMAQSDKSPTKDEHQASEAPANLQIAPIQAKAEESARGIPDSVMEATAAQTQYHATSPTQFWITILSLCLLGFISALDVTILPPALPTITASIGGSSQYIWIANSFVLAQSVLQPLIGQLANILGRKIPVVASIVLFIVGSGIAGGARNVAMLIAGRAVQGVGGGGIYVLIDIVTCDLVAPRHRGKFLGIVQSCAGVAAALGPVLGGLLAARAWRWIFYLNIPVCALPLFTIAFSRTRKADASSTFRNLDYVGNLVFTPSIAAILYGLISGGSEHPWSSWRVILPLALGTAGWVFFHLHQRYFARNPSIPSRLFLTRTSATGFALTFLSAIIGQTAGIFLPVYFQSVAGTTVLISGVLFIPVTVGILFAAATAGVLLSKHGQYRPLHFAGFAFCILGYGLFQLFSRSTHKALVVVAELVAAVGFGIPISTVLPAILAALPESDVASANAAFSFIRTFGYTWGVTIASIIFNAAFDARLDRIGDAGLRDRLRNGGAYALASQARGLGETIDPETWGQVVSVYVASLRAVWWFGLGASALALLLVGLERELELSTELNAEYAFDGGNTEVSDSNRGGSEK
ncbi:major facilitator superfamily domain-containing protein [Nemania abortiva]|nr:major facilitator superfamily domain-containing protein [Nemania abortiva]